MEMGRNVTAVTCFMAAASAATDGAVKAEAEARARAAAKAAKVDAETPPVALQGATPLPLGADPVFRMEMRFTAERGVTGFPAAYRAGPGGPRHPDAVLAAMGATLSTDAVQLVAIPGKGLGVVARRDLPAHTEVHVEVPKVAIAMQATSAHDAQCYHCLRKVPRDGSVPCACDRVFCSDACKDTAMTHYHGALCGAGGGKADAVLEAAAAGDPKYAARGILLPWKLLGWALTAAKTTGTPPVSPLDLPPFCHLHRLADLPAPPDAALSLTTVGARPPPPPQAGPFKYVKAASFALAWSLFYDVLGADAPVLLQLPPTWMLELYSMVAGIGFGMSGASGSEEPEGTALACAGSYFNHSCVPNTSWSATKADGARVVYTTTRAVAAGDELTISYTGNLTKFGRRWRLATQYGFNCACPECREEERLDAAGAPDVLTARQRAADADERDDLVELFAALTDVIAADPSDPVPWALRAHRGILLGGGPLRSYCDAYHVVHHLDPRHGTAWGALANAQAQLGQHTAASASAKKAAALETEPTMKALFKNAVTGYADAGATGYSVVPLMAKMAGGVGKYQLKLMRGVGGMPGLIPLPAAFRAGPGGPRRLDAVLAAVADTRSSDWVRFEVFPGKGIGVVAARDIPAGTTVHVEKPVLAAALPPAGRRACHHCLLPVTAATTVPCACDRVYCSVACMATALQYYHAATCGAGGGRADAMVEEVASTDPIYAIRTLLLQWKLLGWALTVAKSARKPPTSPLDLPPFCYMDRATDLEAPPPVLATTSNGILGAVVAAMRAASYKGTKVNADVIQCVWELFHDLLDGDAVMARLAPEWLLDAITVIDTNVVMPNLRSGVPVTALARGCASFNHSCEPNVAFVIDVPATGSQVTVVTSRAVAAGEELLVSYVDTTAPFVTRRQILQSCRGFTCPCARCLADERDEAARGGPPEGAIWPAPTRRLLPPLPALPVPVPTLAASASASTRRRKPR